ncbi:MAG TPA: hypothetical protein VMV05_01790 [bacterium]|nr:hypothetical protein [bacterium]
MESSKYSESIFCEQCESHVKMTSCRSVPVKPKARPQVEFDYVCVDCGYRSSAVRDLEYLQYSEREFCQKNGLPEFKKKSKPVGVVFDRLALK